MTCIYCGSKKFRGVDSFSKFKTVTSDSKPWRSGFEIGLCEECGFPQTRVTEAWKISASRIYRDYSSKKANQIVGLEQADITGGQIQNRVDLLVGFVLTELSPKIGGKVLDFGCGSGALLRCVSNLRSDLGLFGYDLDDRQIENLRDITSFKQLIFGDFKTELKFDLIFMSHTLEHLTNPRESLEQLRELLSHDGYLAIAVPDCMSDPFKLLVADHCSHFSSKTLETLLLSVGLEVVYLDTKFKTRECWAICKPFVHAIHEVLSVEDTTWLGKSVEWFDVVKDDVSDLAKCGSFGIFGTSNNAIWLFGEFEADIKFFVDEDTSRQGTTLFGLPVLSPAEVIDGSVVYLPFAPPLAAKIAKRLSRPGVSWAVPPLGKLFESFPE
jgi:2-polyprenyl-3-methyl-5-hydroxy-6-metoxy-1,4-benzoquinol methylase